MENPNTVKKTTEETVDTRSFPVIRTSKGLEYLVFSTDDLELVETTPTTYKFLIKKKPWDLLLILVATILIAIT